MADIYSGTPETHTLGPFSNSQAVTPSDSVDLPTTARGLWVGVGGTIVAVARNNVTPDTFVGAQAGSIIPGRFRRVYATGTTATNLIAVW